MLTYLHAYMLTCLHTYILTYIHHAYIHTSYLPQDQNAPRTFSRMCVAEVGTDWRQQLEEEEAGWRRRAAATPPNGGAPAVWDNCGGKPPPAAAIVARQEEILLERDFFLTKEEVRLVQTVTNPADRILLFAGHHLRRIAVAGLSRTPAFDSILCVAVNAKLDQLGEIQGACERLANTPLPFPYSLLGVCGLVCVGRGGATSMCLCLSWVA